MFKNKCFVFILMFSCFVCLAKTRTITAEQYIKRVQKRAVTFEVNEDIHSVYKRITSQSEKCFKDSRIIAGDRRNSKVEYGNLEYTVNNTSKSDSSKQSSISYFQHLGGDDISAFISIVDFEKISAKKTKITIYAFRKWTQKMYDNWINKKADTCPDLKKHFYNS